MIKDLLCLPNSAINQFINQSITSPRKNVNISPIREPPASSTTVQLLKRATAKKSSDCSKREKTRDFDEIPRTLGRIKFGSRPGRPAISRQKRSVTPPPSIHISSTPPFSLFLLRNRIPVSSISRLSRPAPPPPLSFVLSLLPLTVRSTIREAKDEQTKPQIYNLPVAMRIIIEYQKLCYSLFHSAHLLPARRFRGPVQ